MNKSVYTGEYAAVLQLLKNAREGAGITQVQLAERLGQTQSFVSKIERGERRLDIVQLRTILQEFKVSLPKFVEQLESTLAKRN